MLALRRTVFSSGIQLRHFSRNMAEKPLGQPMAKVEPIYGEFKRNSRRVGLIGEKVGMTNMYDEWGFMHAVTVIRVDDCHVVMPKPHVKTLMGFQTMQVGYGCLKLKKATMSQVGHCAKAGLPPKRRLHEFRVTKDAFVEPGTKLYVTHFLPGQKVDVFGTSKGKGFAGGMKRWGFKGQRASHGVSKTHRHIGSTGGCQDPGKVWPGKKMPGRMGGTASMNKAMEIFAIDPSKQCIFIRGHVPGPNKGYVYLRDAWQLKQPLDAPFPTHYPTPEDDISIKFMPTSIANPFDRENTTPVKKQELPGFDEAIGSMDFDESPYEDILDHKDQ